MAHIRVLYRNTQNSLLDILNNDSNSTFRFLSMFSLNGFERKAPYSLRISVILYVAYVAASNSSTIHAIELFRLQLQENEEL